MKLEIVRRNRPKPEFATDVAKWFAALPGDAAVYCLLGRLGEMHQADRVYIARRTKNWLESHVTHEWCAPGIAQTMTRRPIVGGPAYVWISKKISAGYEVQFNRGDVPKRFSDVVMNMMLLGAHSAFGIPIFVGKTPSYTLAYHKVTGTRKWSVAERKEAWVAAEIIGAWLGSRQVTQGAASKTPTVPQPSIFIKTGTALQAITLADLISVEAALNYTQLHITGRKPITRYQSLESWMKKLPGLHFLRVHRSHIINPSRVMKLERNCGAWKITMSDKRELPVGRAYRARLLETLEAQTSKEW